MSAGPRAIALVGLRGAGKSTLGAALAAELGRAWVDTDAVLARRAGDAGAVSARLLERLGEAAFRDLEAAVLAEVLARAGGPVIATGGGCVERRGSRALLRARARCVWLQAPAAVLAARLAAGAPRPPLLPGLDPLAELEALLARRAAWYGEVAELCIDTSAAAPGALARRIALALGARAQGGSVAEANLEARER